MTQKTWRNGHYDWCKQLWKSPQINWDGRLLGCCCNSRYPFNVNVFEVGLEKALSDEMYCDTKKMLLGKIKARENSPCFNCSTYKKMVKENDFLTEDEIAE